MLKREKETEQLQIGDRGREIDPNEERERDRGPRATHNTCAHTHTHTNDGVCE